MMRNKEKRSVWISWSWRMSILLLVLGISACGNEKSGMGNVLYEMDVDHPMRPHLPFVTSIPTEQAIPPEAPDDKLTSSNFNKKCCDGTDEQLLLDCCCPDVLALFEEKLAAGDWDFIGKLTSGDEVFAACRYHPEYQKKFEEIENRFLEEDDDEEWN
jgi:hypothetical protein